MDNVERVARALCGRYEKSEDNWRLYSGDATAAIAAMEQIARENVQRERISARFAGRGTTPATADFDLPAPNDSVEDTPPPPQHGDANG